MIQADARHIPLKSESVQCVVTSPPLSFAVAKQNALVKGFTLRNHRRIHKPLRHWASTQPSFLGEFAFAKIKDGFGLDSFFYQVWCDCFNQSRSHLVSCPINPKRLSRGKPADARVNPRLKTQGAAKGIVDQLQDFAALHSYLNTLVISGAFHVGPIAHSPRGFLDTDVRFAIYDASKWDYLQMAKRRANQLGLILVGSRAGVEGRQRRDE